MPLWSSPMPSSSTAQIMPSEIRPYFFAAVISKPPGRIAPGVANATRSPALKLVAPQITPVSVVRVGGQLGVADGDPAVPDRLLELGQLLDREDLGDDDAADVVADLLDRLDLEAGRGEPPADLLRVDRRGDRRVLAQPGNGYSHRR